MKIFYTKFNKTELLSKKITINKNIYNIVKHTFTYKTSYIINPLNWLTNILECNLNGLETPCVGDTIYYEIPDKYINNDLITYLEFNLSSNVIKQLLDQKLNEYEDPAILFLLNINEDLLEFVKTKFTDIDDLVIEELPTIESHKAEEWVNTIL